MLPEEEGAGKHADAKRSSKTVTVLAITLVPTLILSLLTTKTNLITPFVTGRHSYK
jgi:hypothetical protein